MPELSEALAGVLAKQIDEETKANAAFAAQQASLQEKVGAAQQKLLEKLYGPPKAEYAPEVMAIANALTANPRLVPLVDAFLKKVVAKVNDAVDKALSEAFQ